MKYTLGCPKSATPQKCFDTNNSRKVSLNSHWSKFQQIRINYFDYLKYHRFRIRYVHWPFDTKCWTSPILKYIFRYIIKDFRFFWKALKSPKMGDIAKLLSSAFKKSKSFFWILIGLNFNQSELSFYWYILKIKFNFRHQREINNLETFDLQNFSTADSQIHIYLCSIHTWKNNEQHRFRELHWWWKLHKSGFHFVAWKECNFRNVLQQPHHR